MTTTNNGGKQNSRPFKISSITLICNVCSMQSFQSFKRPALKFMLFMNLRVLIDLGIDGFDFDCEEFTGDNQTDNVLIDVIVEMVSRFNRMGVTIQTFVPYDNINVWMECLMRIFRENGEQFINWLNVQCYSGGDPNKNCLQRVWIDRINADWSSIGIADASNYIVPGFDAIVAVDYIEYHFKWYAAGIVNGGFIWNWKDRTQLTNVKDFYIAMVKGLEYRSGCAIL